MYCGKCGKKLEDGTVFCPACGTRAERFQAAESASVTKSKPVSAATSEAEESVTVTEEAEETVSTAESEPASAAASAAAVTAAMAAETETSGGCPINNWSRIFEYRNYCILMAVLVIAALIAGQIFGKNKYIDAVKNNCPQSYPDITYGQAFDEIFTQKKWGYMESDRGQHIVEFTGKIDREDVMVKMFMQFLIDEEDESFRLIYMEMAGEVLDDFSAGLMLMAIFEAYEEKYASDQEESSETMWEDQDDSYLDGWFQAADEESLDYRSAYGDILLDTGASYGGNCTYALYDLDQDGVMELITSQGTCNADWNNIVYAIEEGYVSMIGIFYGDVVLYEAEDGNGLYSVYGHMDYEMVNRITKNGMQLTETQVSEREIGWDEDYYSNDYPIETAYVGDDSLLLQQG